MDIIFVFETKVSGSNPDRTAITQSYKIVMSQKNLLLSIRVFLTILNEIHNILKKNRKEYNIEYRANKEIAGRLFINKKNININNYKYSLYFFEMISAIWTAFKAAPFLKLSDTTQIFKPLTTLLSSLILLT